MQVECDCFAFSARINVCMYPKQVSVGQELCRAIDSSNTGLSCLPWRARGAQQTGSHLWVYHSQGIHAQLHGFCGSLQLMPSKERGAHDKPMNADAQACSMWCLDTSRIYYVIGFLAALRMELRRLTLVLKPQGTKENQHQIPASQLVAGSFIRPASTPMPRRLPGKRRPLQRQSLTRRRGCDNWGVVGGMSFSRV